MKDYVFLENGRELKTRKMGKPLMCIDYFISTYSYPSRAWEHARKSADRLPVHSAVTLC